MQVRHCIKNIYIYICFILVSEVQKKFPSISKQDIIDKIYNLDFRQKFGNRSFRTKPYVNINMFTSPFCLSIDLAFLSSKKKIYAIFLVAINTYTKKIGLVPIKTKKLVDLKHGIEQVITQKFQNKRIRKIYSDEESGVKSNILKSYFLKEFNVKIITSSLYKQWICERAVLTIKLLLKKIAYLEKKSLYHHWKKFLQQAEDIFNKQFQTNKSINTFFDTEILKFSINAPWHKFRYKIGESVYLYTTKMNRNMVAFKFTRDLGKKNYIFYVLQITVKAR